MAFREQKLATLQGVAQYEIFAPPDYIGLPRRTQLSHDDLRGVVHPMKSKWSAHRTQRTLPSHPRYLYWNAPPDPEPGYHVWSGLDAIIDQAKIIPNPPRERGAIIGKVKDVNYQTPLYLNGVEDEEASFARYPELDIEDPVNSFGSTLGYPWQKGESRVAPVYFSGIGE